MTTMSDILWIFSQFEINHVIKESTEAKLEHIQTTKDVHHEKNKFW